LLIFFTGVFANYSNQIFLTLSNPCPRKQNNPKCLFYRD